MIRLLLPILLLAGCATTPPPTAPESGPVSAQLPAPKPQAVPTAPTLSKGTQAYLAKRGFKPISGRAINAQVSCSFQDEETGYRGQLQLAVRNAGVEQLEARIDVPKRGSCQFRLADFRQTQTLPIVELVAQKSPCKVSLWEQGSQITVAFRDCRAECGGDSVNYLWPILVDSQKGSCS